MPRRSPELTDAQVRRLKWATVGSGLNKGKPCKKLHAVGGVGGLYLQCTPPTTKSGQFGRSWILKYRNAGNTHELGLGPYPDVTLAMARHKARDIKDGIREGKTPPLEARKLRKAELLREQAKKVTLIQLGRRYEARKAAEYKTIKQAKKLTSHLETYVYPLLGEMVVGDIERAHVLQVLTPFWETKTETMSRIRALIENLLDVANAEGLRTGDNPARWKGNLELSLPAPRKIAKVKHFSAMPVSDLRDFMTELEKKTTIGALALRFGILTAARSGEIRGATWDEIDLTKKSWTVPGERMKNGRVHRVPLCDEAINILRELPTENKLVFPSPTGRKLSDMALTKVLKDMGHSVTQHGFRATFRTWVQEHTEYPEEVAELAIAHVNSDRTRAAYARSELIDKRRKLMADWAQFCSQHR